MEIPDFEAAIVEQFLNFLYTGEIRDKANAMNLYAIAAKYDVQQLKTVCSEIILRNLDTTNAFEIYGLGHLHNENDMKMMALSEIKSMFPDIELDDELINQPKNLKELIEIKRQYESVF